MPTASAGSRIRPWTAYRTRLKSALDKVSSLVSKTDLLSLGENNALFEYLNILFLIEVRAFHSYLKLMEKFENQLRDIFETIGFLDAMVAAASYKVGLNESVEPELTDSTPFLDIECVAHPLLEKPVPNSVSLRTGGMLVTGSNMSGKTTFLKNHRRQYASLPRPSISVSPRNLVLPSSIH